ncbi:MAG: cysteine hydrolase [Desulfobulbaceae bacterium]|nr:cysteine hydrolase [Desulfobulbaceae bacterium]
MKQALILIDIQNDYFKGGKMELVGMEQASSNAKRILQKFREKKSSLFHVQHLAADSEATFFLPHTKGAEIHEDVTPELNEILITKHFPNSFRETNLLHLLQKSEIKELVICGAMSHMCIDATTRAAFDLGFKCTVIEDACATRHLYHNGAEVEAHVVHAAFMAALAVPYATILSTNDFLVKQP